MNAEFLQQLLKSCQFDMCALEYNSSQQAIMKCAAYEQFNSICLNYVQVNNLKWIFFWRDLPFINCRKYIKTVLFLKLILNMY